MSYLWGIYQSSPNYRYYGVAFSTDGKYIVGVSYDTSLASNSFLTILKASDGSVIDQRTYPNSISSYDYMTRNLLMTSSGQVVVSSQMCPTVACTGY